MPESQGTREITHPQITELKPREKASPPLWEREVEGVYNAIFYVHQKAREAQGATLSSDDIFELQRLIMNDPLNPQQHGSLRTGQVIYRSKLGDEWVEGPHRPPDPHFLSEYYNEFILDLGSRTSDLSIDSSVEEVLESATWAHMKFVDVHPFNDGNGRVARLLVDYIFSRSRLPAIKDWGDKDVYKKTVQQALTDDSYQAFEDFLTLKLDTRLLDLQLRLKNQSSSNGDNLRRYVASRREEVEKITAESLGHAS